LFFFFFFFWMKAQFIYLQTFTKQDRLLPTVLFSFFFHGAMEKELSFTK